MRLQIQTDKKEKAAKIVLIAGIIAILSGAAFFLFWESPPAPPAPGAQQPMPMPVATAAETAPFAAEAATVSQASYLNSTIDLRQLTEAQATLELEKLNVAIAEQQKRLQELGASPAMPQIVAMPGAAEIGAASPETLPVSERVLSVQGINGQIMATLETAEGLKTVKAGDSFGYGQVERVSILGVEIREGEETRLIAVEE